MGPLDASVEEHLRSFEEELQDVRSVVRAAQARAVASASCWTGPEKNADTPCKVTSAKRPTVALLEAHLSTLEEEFRENLEKRDGVFVQKIQKKLNPPASERLARKFAEASRAAEVVAAERKMSRNRSSSPTVAFRRDVAKLESGIARAAQRLEKSGFQPTIGLENS